MHTFGPKNAIFASMDAQEQHIAVLKKMATAGQTTMLLPGVMLKINASDVIEAGKRLEEMGIFAFDSKTNDVKIVVEIVDPIKKTNLAKKESMKVNRIYHEFINDNIANEDYLVLQGGKRAGKTVGILQYLYQEHVKSKKRSIICTDTYSRLKDSILSDWKYADEVKGISTSVKSGSPRIDFFNGSQIDFTYAGKDTRGFTSDKDFIFLMK